MDVRAYRRLFFWASLMIAENSNRKVKLMLLICQGLFFRMVGWRLSILMRRVPVLLHHGEAFDSVADRDTNYRERDECAEVGRLGRSTLNLKRDRLSKIIKRLGGLPYLLARSFLLSGLSIIHCFSIYDL